MVELSLADYETTVAKTLRFYHFQFVRMPLDLGHPRRLGRSVSAQALA
jgi:hypothetical protein